MNGLGHFTREHHVCRASRIVCAQNCRQAKLFIISGAVVNGNPETRVLNLFGLLPHGEQFLSSFYTRCHNVMHDVQGESGKCLPCADLNQFQCNGLRSLLHKDTHRLLKEHLRLGLALTPWVGLSLVAPCNDPNARAELALVGLEHCLMDHYNELEVFELVRPTCSKTTFNACTITQPTTGTPVEPTNGTNPHQCSCHANASTFDWRAQTQCTC
mmetsp:Transcript_12805/g.32023  ORF Transcript_12805/g.32023 Transcript_12805/m.32023 type:complete len:214 (+) Transcript_12805:518-1159(+)